MKKLFAVILATVMVCAVLAGCGGNAPADPGKKSEAKINVEEILGHAPTGRLKEILDSGEIKFTTSPDYPPYEFVNPEKTGDEQYVGADVELAKYIADQLGVKLVYDIKDFDGVLMCLSQGLTDLGISGLSAKPDRQEAMDFTKMYDGNGEGYHGVMVPVADKDKYKEFSDFDGLTVGAQNGSLQEELANQKLTGAKIKPVVKLSDGILMLQNGTLDALVISSETGLSYIKNYPEFCMCSVVLDDTNVGMSAAVPKGETDLLTIVNYIIDDVLAKDLFSNWVKESKELADSLGIQ